MPAPQGELPYLDTFCKAAELERFMNDADGIAAGWVGFYWGKTPDELRRSAKLGDALTLGWLELFQRRAGMTR